MKTVPGIWYKSGKHQNAWLQYYELRNQTRSILTLEEFETVISLYKSYDYDNLMIAIEIMKSKLNGN